MNVYVNDHNYEVQVNVYVNDNMICVNSTWVEVVVEIHSCNDERLVYDDDE